MAANVVRIHAIVTGATELDTKNPTPESIAQRVKEMNAIFRRVKDKDGVISDDLIVDFEFDPATDVETSTNPDLMNDHPMDPAGNLVQPAASDVDSSANTAIQNDYADQYPGKLVVFFRDWNDEWKNAAGDWISAANFSDINHRMVRAVKGAESYRLAHEIGHYFALGHPHGRAPKDVADAAAMMKNYVEEEGGSIEHADRAFDADYPAVTDTNPDPRGGPLAEVFGDPCGGNGIVPVKVTFVVAGQTVERTFDLAPDRNNLMSYFALDCPQGRANSSLTQDQAKIVRAVLQGDKRKHLIAPRVLYDAVWAPTGAPQKWLLGYDIKDFAADFDKILQEGFHASIMNAVRVEDGEVRYSAVFDPGDTGQTRAIGWAFEDFSKRFSDELAKGRHCAHMQAYDIGGGQIRYDAIWETGGTGENAIFSWAFEDFDARFKQEIGSNRHCSHLQAYDIGGGQIRYDCVWDQGGVDQSWAIGWTLADFAARFNEELSAGRHCVHLQAYHIGAGQIRYDGIWQPGGKGQSRALGWAFNDFGSRFDQEWGNKKRLVHLQAYDIGDVQIRYDGIWESGNPDQTRALGVTFHELAIRNTKEAAKGYRLVHLQAYVRGK